MSNEKNIHTAALIVIGDEILNGTTSDANAAFIANKLTSKGIKLMEVRIIGDISDDIISTVQDLKDKYDYIFTTGGIGPTHDDITSETIAKAFKIELEINETAKNILEEYYDDQNLNNARLKMAYIPKGAKLIENPITAAPGFIIENIYVMAGIPRVMQAMFVKLLDNLPEGPPILSNTISCDLYESQIADALTAIQQEYLNVAIGSYPQYRGGEHGLNIAIRSTNKKMLEDATNKVILAIKELGGTSKAINIRID